MKKHEILYNGPLPISSIIATEGLKPYNFKETDETSVEVEMYGQVVENRPIDFWTGEERKGLYIVLAEFLKDLDTYKEKDNITFRINSVGGDLYAGIAICNRISELKGNTVTIVDGLAASAASVILQGGKKRKAFAGSQVMVHGASVFMFGSYNMRDLQQMERRIEGGNKSVIETYAARTGKEKGYIKSLMDKEEWMTGQEAIDNGFVDEIIDTDKKVELSLSVDRQVIVSNGIPMSAMGFKNMPENIRIMQVTPGSSPVVIEKKKEKTGGEENMDKEELKKKYPELVEQIENEAKSSVKDSFDAEAIKKKAVDEERSRMKEIEEIENQIADKKLVNKAKYETPMTAQELAFTAMKQQKKEGSNFMDDLLGDSAGSGVGDVNPTPNSGQKSAEEQALEDIENGAKLIAGTAE